MSEKEKYVPAISKDKTCIDPVSGLVIRDCVLNDSGNISGFIDTENGPEKALYNCVKNTWVFGGKNISKSCLIDLGDRTLTERQEIGRKGGIATREKREKQKSLNDIARAMLDKALTEKQAKKLSGDNSDIIDLAGEDLTVGALLVARGIVGALDGSFKWYEAITATAGYAPKKEIDINADIMTDADRELLALVEKRTAKTG